LVEDPFDPDYDGENLLSAMETAEPQGAVQPVLAPQSYPAPQVRAGPSRAQTIASGAAGVAGGVASAVVPMTGNIAASFGLLTWFGIAAVILSLATCRLGAPLSLMGLLPLGATALFASVIAWYRVYRSVTYNLGERLLCRLVPGMVLIFLLMRLDEAAAHARLVAKAIVLAGLTVGCYYLAADRSQSSGGTRESRPDGTHESAFVGGTPRPNMAFPDVPDPGRTHAGFRPNFVPSTDSGQFPSTGSGQAPTGPGQASDPNVVFKPVAAPTFQSTGRKGSVSLQLLADGYPGDSNFLCNRIGQNLKPRLEAAGIGVDPSASFKLLVGVERIGSKRARVVQYANARMPFGPQHEIQIDDVVAKISVIDASGAVVYERHRSPGLVDGRRMIGAGDDETAVFSRMQWDAAAGLVDSLELPSLLQHPPELPALRNQLAAAINGGTNGKSREQAKRDLGDLITQAGSLHVAHPDDSDCDLSSFVGQLQAKIAGLPTEEPAVSLFQEAGYPPMPNPYNANAAFGDEVTFKGFVIRPPRDMVVDLQSSEISQDTLPWHVAGPGQAAFVMRSVPRADPAQKQPWVTTLDAVTEVARNRRLFAIQISPNASIMRGRVNGIDLTRLEPEPSVRSAPESRLRYVALDGDNWVTIEMTTAWPVIWFPTPASFRRLKAGEARSDPLSPARVAARLGVDGDAAEAVLIRQGAAAEDAVLAILAKDGPAGVSAAKVLQSIGTAKSVPGLKAALHFKEPGLSSAARAALRVVAPHELDAIAEALLDLESTDTGTSDAALKTLAAGPVDPARKAAVEPALELFFAGSQQADTKDLGNALSVWRTEQTADLLLKALGNAKSAARQVEAAMVFAAATQDKRLVYPVIRWINTPSGDRCVECLIAMGPMVETELLKLARYDDDVARANAAKVLAKVGTAKAIPALTIMSRDPRYPTAGDAAGLALVEIKARAAATAATQPSK
jgi:hypothetical protein